MTVEIFYLPILLQAAAPKSSNRATEQHFLIIICFYYGREHELITFVHAQQLASLRPGDVVWGWLGGWGPFVSKLQIISCQELTSKGKHRY